MPHLKHNIVSPDPKTLKNRLLLLLQESFSLVPLELDAEY
jgi:hypothetical protein